MNARFQDQRPAIASSDEGNRGPLAVAVSILVMIAGAMFLVFAMSSVPARTPIKRLPEAAETHVVEITAPPPAEQQPEGATIAAPAAQPDATAPASDGSPAAAGQGLTPRLSPERAERLANQGAQDAPPRDELTPRLKPGSAPETPRPVTVLGRALLADADDTPPPFYFTSDIEPGPGPEKPPLAVALEGDVNGGPQTTVVALSKGETFVDALARAGIRAQDRNAAAYAFGEYQDLRMLRPGQEFVLTTTEPNQTLFQMVAREYGTQSYLLALDFKQDAENRVSLRRSSDDSFVAEKHTTPLTTRLVAVNGRIDGSLFLSAKRVGAPDMVIAEFANIFAYDVDFQREIFGGDEFEAIFELSYDEDGALVSSGDILYGRLKWRGRTKEKGYYRYAAEDGGKRADYFDAAGQSAKRLLMKTPIDGARLSSGFGTRKHPILGYRRAHKGVDFAAPRGTPIKAAGDGVIERANRYGSFGNYIRIRHANGYKTAYAHLNGFARGVRAGKRVDQGDIIGYVGTTGRSTGPHLHYEVHLKDKPVNPQRLKIATGVQLKGSELERFKAFRDRIDAMRRPTGDGPAVLAQDDRDAADL